MWPVRAGQRGRQRERPERGVANSERTERGWQSGAGREEPTEKGWQSGAGRERSDSVSIQQKERKKIGGEKRYVRGMDNRRKEEKRRGEERMQQVGFRLLINDLMKTKIRRI